jgi:hypothetical protein
MFTPEMEMRIRPPSSVRGAMAEVAGDREVADNAGDFKGTWLSHGGLSYGYRGINE